MVSGEIDYKSEAIKLFPDIDFSEFGKLIEFEYNGFIRPVVLNGLNKHHLWGFCLKRWIHDHDFEERLFNMDVIDSHGYITDLSDGQRYTMRAFYEQYLPIYYPDRKFGYSFKELHSKPQVYFTGFPSAVKKELEKKATEADMWVTSDMTENMEYLVCGPRAGQKKIEKAQKIGTVILTAEGFNTLLETGEIISKTPFSES